MMTTDDQRFKHTDFNEKSRPNKYTLNVDGSGSKLNGGSSVFS
jgi:hypothetical protein